MQQHMTVYDVFIAAPADAADSRVAVRDAILLWNASHGKSRKVILNPVGWDTNSTPEMGDTAQQILNRQLLDNADILIATFHGKLGTPTENARSGTVEEIERSMAA